MLRLQSSEDLNHLKGSEYKVYFSYLAVAQF